jgi:hypothetical protein
MYFVCTDRFPPIAHASLEAALKTLRSELRAREQQGFEVSFNDKLEFQLSRSEARGGIDGAPYRMWVEDEHGQNVTSKDAAEGG